MRISVSSGSDPKILLRALKVYDIRVEHEIDKRRCLRRFVINLL